MARAPRILTVPIALDGERADVALPKLWEQAEGESLSRTNARRWLDEQRVRAGERLVRAAERLRSGTKLSVSPPPPLPSSAQPEPMDLVVLFEDEELLVLDKPAGLVVHPAPGSPTGTLVNGLLHRFGAAFVDLAKLPPPLDDDDAERTHNALLRPGIVHRLDRGTSGVMVVAKSVRARDHLSKLFAAHDIERSYLAIVQGALTDATTYETLHGRHPRDRKRFTTKVNSGKRASTHVSPLEALHGATLVRCTLSTGRTHQIRVHLTEAGHALVGDPVYGSAPRDEPARSVAAALGRPALHAAVLGFAHPVDSRALRFTTEPPEDFQRALTALR